MTTLLTIAANPEAPIACDFTTAGDTPEERLAEYGRVFDYALTQRVRTADGSGSSSPANLAWPAG